MMHPYSIEDRRQPDEPTRAEVEFERVIDGMTLVKFFERLERDDSLREIFADRIDGPAEGVAKRLQGAVEDAIRRDVESGIERDRLADAAEDYYARMGS